MEWIALHEGLPDWGETVLLAVSGEDKPIVGWLSQNNEWKEGSEFIEPVGDSYLIRQIEDEYTVVTHWAELPEMPPKQ